MDDETQLARRVAAGDEAALEALLERHRPGLAAFVRLRAGGAVRSHEETVDLVQSVCREVIEHRDRFAHPEANGFKRWLYATALRKIGHRAEYWRAEKRDPGREALDTPELEALADAYRTVTTPSRFAETRETVERLEAAFAKLSEEQREVVLLSRVAGLPHAEVARELGLTEVAVRSRLARALARLAELVEPG